MLLLSLLLLCSAGNNYLQDDGSTDENTLKALFIYNFTKQIEWPSASLQGTRFIISIYGSSPVKDKLQLVMKGRRIFDKNVEIKEISRPEDISGSHILFIPKGSGHKLSIFLEAYADKGVLIITEEKGMTNRGAGINIIEKDSRLRFELNDGALKKQGLKVSNQLYNLAINIRS